MKMIKNNDSSRAYKKKEKMRLSNKKQQKSSVKIGKTLDIPMKLVYNFNIDRIIKCVLKENESKDVPNC